MKNKNLDNILKGLDDKFLLRIRETDGMPYAGRIHALLSEYVEKIKRLEDIDRTAYDKCVEYCERLQYSFSLYDCGKVSECFDSFRSLLHISRAKPDGPTATYYASATVVEKGRSLFRMRKNGTKPFDEYGLFHVPFQLRGIVSTMRFSIPGLPCLYMGATPYCCWEEIMNPEKFTIARFDTQEKLHFLDLRFKVPLNDKTEKTNYLVFYPFRIVCTIPVDEKHTNDRYKPEYVISQALLHLSILENSKTRFDGIISTSTKYVTNPTMYDDIREADNYTVPVDEIKQFGYSQKLLSQYKITRLCDIERYERPSNLAHNKEFWVKLNNALLE